MAVEPETTVWDNIFNIEGVKPYFKKSLPNPNQVVFMPIANQIMN